MGGRWRAQVVVSEKPTARPWSVLRSDLRGLGIDQGTAEASPLGVGRFRDPEVPYHQALA